MSGFPLINQTKLVQITRSAFNKAVMKSPRSQKTSDPIVIPKPGSETVTAEAPPPRE